MLFKVRQKPDRFGNNQEVMCPRCRIPCNLVKAVSNTEGPNNSIRKVVSNFNCGCSYKVDVIERYPVINMTPSN